MIHHQEARIPTISCDAILFDLDGVLVDSRQCIEYIWQSWAEARGLDPEPIIRVAHGRRTSETLRDVAPHLDIPTEVAALDKLEEVETRGLCPVEGVPTLLSGLPPDRWAVVTSGSPKIAALRLRVAGVQSLPLLVTGADVSRGKPAPDPYLLAADRLGVPPVRCVVVEDAPAGVASGKAAGMQVIGSGHGVARSAAARRLLRRTLRQPEYRRDHLGPSDACCRL